MRRLLTIIVVLVFSFMVSPTRLAAKGPELAHMVFFTMAEDTKANREALVAACQKYLSDHEGTSYFSAGAICEDLNREVNDRDFDVALHLVFVDKAAHDKYQDHPKHVKFVEENKHLWTKVRVFDSYVAAPGKDAVPKSAQGFSGIIEGIVAHKQGDQLLLSVTEIGKTWIHSKATAPRDLIGKRVQVESNNLDTPIHKFVSLVKVGDSVVFDVAHRDGDSLHILELTDEQRQRVRTN